MYSRTEGGVGVLQNEHGAGIRQAKKTGEICGYLRDE